MTSKNVRSPEEFLEILYPQRATGATVKPGPKASVTKKMILESLFDEVSWQKVTQAILEVNLLDRIKTKSQDSEFTRDDLSEYFYQINADIAGTFSAELPLYLSRCKFQDGTVKVFMVLAVFNSVAATAAHNRANEIKKENADAKEQEDAVAKYRSVQVPNEINYAIAEALGLSEKKEERELANRILAALPKLRPGGTGDHTTEKLSSDHSTKDQAEDIEFFRSSWVLEIRVDYCEVSKETPRRLRAWESIADQMAKNSSSDEERLSLLNAVLGEWNETESAYRMPKDTKGEVVFIPRETAGEYTVKFLGYYKETLILDHSKVRQTWSVVGNCGLGKNYRKLMKGQSLRLAVDQGGADAEVPLLVEFPIKDSTLDNESDIKVYYNIGKARQDFEHIASATILSKTMIARMF